MTTQPIALRLADAICDYSRLGFESEEAAKKRRMEAHREAAAELRRLHAEVEALRADAERYRWLRDRATFYHTRQNTAEGERYVTAWRVVTGGSDFCIDAAIDAARSKV